MDNLGFIQCDVDHSVFFKITLDPNSLIIILVHVNNCTLVSTSLGLIDWVKNSVKEFMEIIDIGEIHWLLDIEVKRDRETGKIILSQQSYINASLCQFGLKDIKPVSTPIDLAIHLTSNQSPKSTTENAHITKIPYQKAIGTLIYATLGT